MARRRLESGSRASRLCRARVARDVLRNPENPVFQEEVFEPATQYRPHYVRNLLRAIHGFTQEGLESASTDIPEILMGFIDDPNEGNLVQRQAIKALRLYPAEETLGFIEGRVDASPRGLQILYVLSLGGFAEGAPARVSTVMENMLEHADRGIRSAALNLSRSLRTPRASLALQNRLAREPDPNLRRAIQQQLNVR